MSKSTVSRPGAATNTPDRISSEGEALCGAESPRADSSNSFVNYYDLLKIGPNASNEEISDAFWEQAKEWHPERTERKGARERFVAFYQAFQILRNQPRRRVYDRLRMVERDVQSPRDPEWLRYTRWTEIAQIEGEALADADYEKLSNSILISNTLLFLRIIALGEETPDAFVWIMIGLKMTALAVIIFMMTNFTELTALLTFSEPAELSHLAKTDLERKIIGIGMSAAVYLVYSSTLIFVASRSSVPESFLGRAVGEIFTLFFSWKNVAFPILPVILIFGLVYALLMEVFERII